MVSVSKCTALWIMKVLMLLQLSSTVALPGEQAEQHRKRVGLALSGGGARGAAHIGVLKVLESEGVRVDCIAGTSAGSIIGGLYAAGYSADQIETLMVSHWREILSNRPERSLAPLIQRQDLRHILHLHLDGLRPQLPTGLIEGRNLVKLFDQWTLGPIHAAGYDFDKLPIAFRAISTNLLTGEPYIYRSGRISEAVRASAALPIVFTPASKDGLLLVDGGLSDQLPADILEEMGADIVIAVDATSPNLKHQNVRNVLNVVGQSIGLLTKQTVHQHYKHAHLVIRPELDGYDSNSYAQMAEIIDRGVAAAEAHMPKIRALVGEPDSKVVNGKMPAAIDCTIDSISFELASSPSRFRALPPSYFLRKINSRPGDKIDPEKLKIDVERLYATGMFDKVDYECRQAKATEDRCLLIYHLTESLPNTLGLSLRYDLEYRWQGLMEFTGHNLFGTTSYATFASRFGETGFHTATLRLIHPRLPFLFVESQAQVLKRERFINEQEDAKTYLDKRRGAQLMLGMNLSRSFEALAGYRFETGKFLAKNELNQAIPRTNLSGLRLRLDRDTLDAQEFPRSGMTMDFQVDRKLPTFGADRSYQTIQGKVQGNFSPTDKTTLTLRFAGFKSAGDLPDFEKAFVGGYGFSDSSSFRLVGYKRDELTLSKMAIGGVSYRRQLFNKPLSLIGRGYVSLEYNLASIGRPPGTPGYRGTIHGGAIGFALDTMLGPIRVAAGVGQAGKLRLYLSFGPSF